MKVVTAYQMITAHFAGPIPVAQRKLQSNIHWLHTELSACPLLNKGLYLYFLCLLPEEIFFFFFMVNLVKDHWKVENKTHKTSERLDIYFGCFEILGVFVCCFVLFLKKGLYDYLSYHIHRYIKDLVAKAYFFFLPLYRIAAIFFLRGLKQTLVKMYEKFVPEN